MDEILKVVLLRNISALFIKLITRFRVEFTYLNEHKFRRHFSDTVSRMCDCGSEIESTQHFLLHCPFFLVKEINALKVFII